MVKLAIIISLFSSSVATAQFIDSSSIAFAFRGEGQYSYAGSWLRGVGDINNDGFADIAVSSSDPAGTYIFYGNPNREAEPDAFLRGYYGPAAAIDVDADGIKELVVTTQEDYPSLDATLWIYRTYPDSVASEPYDSLKPPSSNYDFASYFMIGDPDADGLENLIALSPKKVQGEHHEEFSLYEASPFGLVAQVWNYEMGSIQNTATWAGQNAFGFIDFNGDGVTDIFVGHTADPDDPNFVGFFRGPDFDSVPSDTLFPVTLDTAREQYFAEHVYNIGDVNGDGWADLGMNYDGWTVIYLGGPVFDQQYDYVLQSKSRCVSAIGDVNHDGYGDIAVGASRTAYGTVEVYLGGPRFDTIPDDMIFRSDLPPWFLSDLGNSISAVGDFDGDGIDDFVFNCLNFVIEQRGAAFVIKGDPRIMVPVEEPANPDLPESFRLLQNYPNPSNPTTTIEFSLDKQLTVTLEVLNSIGQTVKTIVSSTRYPAGCFSVSWDGKDADGKVLASGVYLIRLRTSEESSVRKMTLVK